MSSDRKQIQKTLKQKGFELVRSKNHFVYRNAKGCTIIVPNHNKMNPITFKQIMKQLEVA